MISVPRVILAGGKAPPDLAAEIHCTVRAMALFQGEPLLNLVVDALAAADPSAPVTVVGDVPDSSCYRRIPDRGDFVSNVIAGAEACRESEWMLVSSADLPFLTAAVVTGFLRDAAALASARGADLVYPVVPVSSCYASFPGIKRTAVRLREGALTGGNILLARPSFFLDRRVVLAQTYAARKHPFRLARMLGPSILARLAVSQLIWPGALSVEALERSVGRLVGARVAGLVSDAPELATDLDRPSDFAVASLLVRAEVDPAIAGKVSAPRD